MAEVPKNQQLQHFLLTPYSIGANLLTREFIEVPEFSRKWKALGLTDDELYELQIFLCQNPDYGDAIQGTGGIRKIRWATPGRGKSGSIRVIYIDVVVSQKLYLLTVYKKNVQVNLSNEQKSTLKALVEKLKKEGTKNE